MTEQISQSKTPLVHKVISIFDNITQTLDAHNNDATFPPAIHIAAAHRHTMLNKHYGLSNDSIVYRIKMCKCCLLQAMSVKLICLCVVVLHP